MSDLGYVSKQGWVPYDTGTASNVITTSTIQQYVEQYTPADNHDYVFESTLNHGCIIGGTNTDQENGIQVLRTNINNVNNIDTNSITATTVNCSTINEIGTTGVNIETIMLKDGVITVPDINSTSNLNITSPSNTNFIDGNTAGTWLTLDNLNRKVYVGESGTTGHILGGTGLTVQGGADTLGNASNLNLYPQSSTNANGGSLFMRSGHSTTPSSAAIILRAGNNNTNIAKFQNSASADQLIIPTAIVNNESQTRVLCQDAATKQMQYRTIPASISTISVTKATEILVFNAGVLTGTNTNVYFNLRSIYDSSVDVRIVHAYIQIAFYTGWRIISRPLCPQPPLEQ